MTKMSKETVEAILASENLSTLGTKKEIKARSRDFVNDRRDAAARDNTIFDDSITEKVEQQQQQDTEQAGGPSFPAPPEDITAESFDTAMHNLFSQGGGVKTSLEPPAPVSRSTVIFDNRTTTKPYVYANIHSC